MTILRCRQNLTITLSVFAFVLIACASGTRTVAQTINHQSQTQASAAHQEKKPRRRLKLPTLDDFHKKIVPRKNLLKQRFKLSDKDLKTIQDLPGVCQSELPGLDQSDLAETHGKERGIWREDELSDHQQAVAKLVNYDCLLYTSPSPRDQRGSRMPSSA